jgi:hypothetical protein
MDENPEIVGAADELVDHQGHVACLAGVSRNPTYHRRSPPAIRLG